MECALTQPWSQTSCRSDRDLNWDLDSDLGPAEVHLWRLTFLPLTEFLSSSLVSSFLIGYSKLKL